MDAGDDAAKRYEETLKQMVAHADRVWKAEEQNAARIATRANLALTAISAVIGLKVFAFGKEAGTIIDSTATALWKAAFVTFFFGSAACLMIALYCVLRVGWRKNASASASNGLVLPQDVARAFLSGPREEAPHATIYEHVMEAATDLSDRNTARNTSVSSAFWWFWMGLLATICTIGSYTVVARGARTHGQQGPTHLPAKP